MLTLTKLLLDLLLIPHHNHTKNEQMYISIQSISYKSASHLPVAVVKPVILIAGHGIVISVISMSSSSKLVVSTHTVVCPLFSKARTNTAENLMKAAENLIKAAENLIKAAEKESRTQIKL